MYFYIYLKSNGDIEQSYREDKRIWHLFPEFIIIIIDSYMFMLWNTF